MAEPPPPIAQAKDVEATLPGPPPPSYTDTQAQMPQPGHQGQQGQPLPQQQPQQSGAPPLCFMDFIPTAMSRGGTFSMPTYERFDVLMARANQWLVGNPGLKVVTCESAESKAAPHQPQLLTNDISTYYESGKYASYYIRFLRLWMKPRGPQDGAGPSQIGHLNIIPACLNPGGTFAMPVFENFGQTIGRLNEMFKAQPLPGRILTVETQDMKFYTWDNSLDPDGTFWRESGKYSDYFLNIIRVFYEAGPPAHEQIGVVDFVPSKMAQGGTMNISQFEPFHSLVAKASAWMASNAALNVVNVQSVDYKLNTQWGGEGPLDTHRTLFRESGRFATFYVRILRVCYLTGGSSRPKPMSLTYRTFVPCQTSSGNIMMLGRFETLSATLARAQAWLSLTGARPIACETVPVKMYVGQRNQGGGGVMESELTYTYNSGRYSETFLFVLRVYFDGPYQEPPLEALPPPPMITEDAVQCCTIL